MAQAGWVDLAGWLIEQGVAAPPGALRQTLEEAAAQGRHPVEALAAAKLLPEDVLADLLARHAGTVVVNLDVERPEPELLAWVPEDEADRRLLLPLESPPGVSVRVAFALPGDAEAVRWAQQALRGAVHPVGAPLTPLKAAIERAYGRDLPRETTARIEVARSDTAPLSRLELGATPEQRVEALLLALIDKGILTRAEYAEALRRLLTP